MTDQAPPGPRTAVVLLGVLVALLVGASVLMGVRYAGAVDERVREAGLQEQASRTRAENQDRLADAMARTDEVRGRITDLERRNAELRKCAEPARDSIIALRDDNDAALDSALDRVADNC